MRSLVPIAVVITMAAARPEMYREKEDFQFARSSSDEGSKSGYYGAQRGNMGGNYERAHNMDSLAQHQMSGLIHQVDGELGDASNTKTGSVFTAANSRGIYGSGHYDLSNLEGRNFQEGMSLGNSQSQSALTNSAYRDHSSNENRYRNSNSYSHSSRHSNSERSEYEQRGVQSSSLRSGDSTYQQEYGAYDGSSRVSHSASPYQNRLVSTRPMKILVRPGTRVTVPISTQTFDADQSASSYDSSLYNQHAAKSDAEVITKNAHESHNKQNPASKHYESSYSYHKEWEKHDASPGAVPLGINDHLIPKTSELYDDSQQSQTYNSRNQEFTSNAANSHNRHSSNLYGYNAKSNLDSSSHLKQQSAYDIQGEKLSSDLNAYTSNAHQSNYDANLVNQQETTNSKPKSYQSSYSYHKSWERQGDPYVIVPVPDVQNGQASQRLISASNSHNGYSSHQYGSNHKTSHQSYSSSNGLMDCDCDEEGHIRVARSYNLDQEVQQQQNGWEDYGQQSQQTQKNIEDLGQQTQNQWDELEDLGQQTQIQWDRIEDLGQQTQNKWEDVGQQTQSQWDKIEDLGQQTQNKWEDVGQQTQSQWDKVEDLGQQTQNKWEDVGQQTQSQWDEIKDLGQQTQNEWNKIDDQQQTQSKLDKIEDLGQQSQNQWNENEDLGQQSHKQLDKIKDLGQQSQNPWDKIEDLGEQSQNQLGNQDNFDQQSQSNVDQEQATWGKLEKSQKQSNKNHESKEASVSLFEDKNSDTYTSQNIFRETSTITNLPQDTDIQASINYLQNSQHFYEHEDGYLHDLYQSHLNSNKNTYSHGETHNIDKQSTVLDKEQTVLQNKYLHQQATDNTLSEATTQVTYGINSLWDKIDRLDRESSLNNFYSINQNNSLDNDHQPSHKKEITTTEKAKYFVTNVRHPKDIGRGDIETEDTNFELNHIINTPEESTNRKHVDISWETVQANENFDQQSMHQDFDAINRRSESSDQQSMKEDILHKVHELSDQHYFYQNSQDIDIAHQNIEKDKATFNQQEFDQGLAVFSNDKNTDLENMEQYLQSFDNPSENFGEYNSNEKLVDLNKLNDNRSTEQQTIEQTLKITHNFDQDNQNLVDFSKFDNNNDQQTINQHLDSYHQENENLAQENIAQSMQNFDKPNSFDQDNTNQNIDIEKRNENFEVGIPRDSFNQQNLDLDFEGRTSKKEILAKNTAHSNSKPISNNLSPSIESAHFVSQTTVSPSSEQKGFWATVGKKLNKAKDKVASWFKKTSE